MKWNIFDKTGSRVVCTTGKIEYNGSFMGERYVQVSVSSETPVSFEIGDYIYYRGEFFYLKYIPTVEKSGTSGSTSDAFKYENIKFSSVLDELSECEFLDYVLEDNNVHYTSLPDFSFYCETIQQLADRIQANLNRLYTGDKAWTVRCYPENVSITKKSISASNINCWGALALVNSQFKTNFIVRNRTISIGIVGEVTDYVFKYGSGNGLYDITRNTDSSQAIITRLYAYGNTTNMPEDYYDTPDKMAVRNLMLPVFPKTSLQDYWTNSVYPNLTDAQKAAYAGITFSTNPLRPYINSANVDVLGVKEGTKFFNEDSDVYPDIYPSMENMTAASLRAAGLTIDLDAGDNGNLDEVATDSLNSDDTAITDNGKWTGYDTNGKTIPQFKIYLKDLGFNFEDVMTTGRKFKIVMKDGMCGGREFEEQSATKVGNKWVVTCNRVQDTSLSLYFPYGDYNIKAGDKFVITGINMPEAYILAASYKLLMNGISFLKDNDYSRYTYTLKIDEIAINDIDKIRGSAGKSTLKNSLYEGNTLMFEDSDISSSKAIIIDSLKITEGDKMLPEYEVTLNDNKEVGTIQKLQNQVSSLAGSISSAYNGSQIVTIVEGQLSSMFVRKDVNDTVYGILSFDNAIKSTAFIDGFDGKGWEINPDGSSIFETMKVRADVFLGGKVGTPNFTSGFSGSGWQIDGSDSRATFNYLTVRKSMKVYEIVYSQILGLNGSYIFSDSNKIKTVTKTGTATYSCVIDSVEDAMRMNLREGDVVRMQHSEGINIRYFYGRVDSITDTTFVLTIIDGEDIPQAGDFVFRMGNVSDTSRQGMIYVTSSDDHAPYLDVMSGITSASFAGCTKVRLGNLQGITVNGYSLSGYGLYVNGGIYDNCVYYMKDGSTIEQAFEVMNGKLNSSISEVRNDLSVSDGNILKNSSFGSDTNYWEYTGSVHFINVNGAYLYLSNYFYVDKESIADIYSDEGRNVLRIKNCTIKQYNAVMNKPTHTQTQSTYTYSFALFVKALTSGTLSVGFSGTSLYTTQTLSASSDYVKISKVAQWNESGDFSISYTGEVLVYGVSLFQDALADATQKLQTQITQNANDILLKASKSTVDSMGNTISSMSASINVNANNITSLVTRTTNVEGRMTTAESSINQTATSIENKVWLQDLNGNLIVSKVNQTATTYKIEANYIKFEGKMITTNNYFKILSDGSMQAVNGDFSGKITATSGTIGGLTLGNDMMTGTGFKINSYGVFFEDGTSTAAMGSSTIDASTGMNPMLWIQDTAANARDGIFVNFPNAYTTGGTAYNNNAVKIIGDVYTFGGMCNFKAVTNNIEMSSYYNHRQVYVFHPSGTSTPTKYLPSIQSMIQTTGSSYFYAEYVIMVDDGSPASVLIKPYGSDILINTQSGSYTTIKSIEIYPRNIVRIAYCIGKWYLLSTTNNVTITNN